MFNIDYQQYRSNMAWSALETEFEDNKKAKRVVFYGNSCEISCFKRLSFYLFNHGIDI